MTPATFPLKVYQGDTYSWSFALWQDRARTLPVDLTGVTAKAEIRDRPGGPLVLPLPLSITLPNMIVADLSRDDSLRLERRNGVWDLQLTLDDGTVTTIVSGHVLVTASVTDSAA
jgi:hypothetical protein